MIHLVCYPSTFRYALHKSINRCCRAMCVAVFLLPLIDTSTAWKGTFLEMEAFQNIKSISWVRSHFLAFLFYFYWLYGWKIPEGTIIFIGESLVEQFQDLSGSWNKCKETNQKKKLQIALMLCLKTTSYNLWDMEYLTRKPWRKGFWEDDRLKGYTYFSLFPISTQALSTSPNLGLKVQNYFYLGNNRSLKMGVNILKPYGEIQGWAEKFNMLNI